MRAQIKGKLDQNIKQNAELLRTQHTRNLQLLLSKKNAMQSAHALLKTKQHNEKLAQCKKLQSRLQKG